MASLRLAQETVLSLQSDRGAPLRVEDLPDIQELVDEVLRDKSLPLVDLTLSPHRVLQAVPALRGIA